MKSTDQKKTFRADTEGVKKLTRSAQRKLTVTCIAIAAIALILLGAGLNYFHGRDTESGSASLDEMRSSLQGQLKEEMAFASSYLEKLDGSIAENQKKLEEVNQQLLTRQESLWEVETTQKKLEENASDVSVKVQELEKKTETQVNTLQKNMNSIHDDIRTTMDKISSIMESLEKNSIEEAADRTQYMSEFSKMNVSVWEVNQSVSQVEEKLNKSYENMKSLMKELKEEEESLRELLKKFHAEEKDSQEEIVQQLSGLMQQLSEVENSLKSILEADMTLITSTFAEMTADFQAQFSKLEQLVDGRFESLNQNMSGGFDNLGQSMNGGFDNLGQSMNGNFDNLGQSMNGGFDNLGQSMNGGFENLGQSVNGGFDNLGQDMSGKLDDLGQNVNGSLNSLGQTIDGSFGNLSQNFDSALTNLDQKMNGQFEAVNQTLIHQITELAASSGQNNDALIAYLEALNSALKQDLNQVFTSVSDGKKELASALLTKGVTAKDDATFAQIRDAILNIDQKIVIGVQEIPGTIRYQYHYHTDASGQNPHAESSSTEGGCYTAANVHYHTDECYTKEYYHTHTSDCPYTPVWVDWVENPYWGADYTCGDRPLNNSRNVLVCTKKEGTVEGYSPSCGLVDGQIIGAEIVYDRSAAEAKAVNSPAKGKARAVAAEETAAGESNLPPRLSEEEVKGLKQQEKESVQQTEESERPEEESVQRTEEAEQPEEESVQQAEESGQPEKESVQQAEEAEQAETESLQLREEFEQAETDSLQSTGESVQPTETFPGTDSEISE